MAEKKLSASNSGVRGKFKKTNKAKAFAEYVWNSLDSGATEVEINVRFDHELDQVMDITISDNGSGIKVNRGASPFDEFENSAKKYSENPLIRGKYGRGRLSFFKFCRSASWVSKHESNEKAVEIKITDGSLDKFIIESTDSYTLLGKTGTNVTFNELNLTLNEFNNIFVDYLETNVCWIKKLKPKIKITVNSHSLNTPSLIDESEINDSVLGEDVNINVIVWDKPIVSEKPHIYFCDLENNVVAKTSYKAKNSFNCSCVVKSEWFSQFVDKQNGQLVNKLDVNSEKFNGIKKFAKNNLDSKYQEIRRSAIDELIEEYEREGIISCSNSSSPLNKFKNQQLKDAIKVIYQADSSVFTELANKKQKAILVKLIDRIVNSDDPDSLFEVLNGVISLSDSDMKTLSNTLEKVAMTNIVKTIEQLEGRLEVLDMFENLLKNKSDTYEVAHIQKIVETNMWIFGEEFNVLTTEEEKFDKALRKYLNFKDENFEVQDNIECEDFNPRHFNKYSIDHKHKNKEMDIFASQKMPMYNQGKSYFKNTVIELKRPSVKLTDKELQQIKNYMNVIKAEEHFDTINDHWDFILVGNQISKNPQNNFSIYSELDSNKLHGKPGLVLTTGNMRIWIKEWSQIISDYKLRYNHIINSLNRRFSDLQEDNPDLITEKIKGISIN
ncbi:ATP-binding protein [Vibrio diabolicus]